MFAFYAQVTEGVSIFRIEPLAPSPASQYPAVPVLRRRILGHISNAFTFKPSILFTFGATPNYLLLPGFPLVIDALNTFFSNAEVKKLNWLEWQPSLGTHFHLIRRADSKVTSFFLPEPLWAWNIVNTWELADGTGVAADLIMDDVPDCGMLHALYLDRLRAGARAGPGLPRNHLARLTIRWQGTPPPLPPRGSGPAPLRAFSTQPGGFGFGFFGRGGVPVEPPACLDIVPLPLPPSLYGGHFRTTSTGRAVHPAVFGRPYRYFYGTCCSSQPLSTPDQICRVDVVENRSLRYHRDGFFVGGQVLFVPSPGSTSETQGVLLADLSGPSGAFLVALDAASLDELAVFALPYRLPLCHSLLFVPRAEGGSGSVTLKMDEPDESRSPYSSSMELSPVGSSNSLLKAAGRQCDHDCQRN